MTNAFDEVWCESFWSYFSVEWPEGHTDRSAASSWVDWQESNGMAACKDERKHAPWRYSFSVTCFLLAINSIPTVIPCHVSDTLRADNVATCNRKHQKEDTSEWKTGDVRWGKWTVVSSLSNKRIKTTPCLRTELCLRWRHQSFLASSWTPDSQVRLVYECRYIHWWTAKTENMHYLIKAWKYRHLPGDTTQVRTWSKATGLWDLYTVHNNYP